MEEVRGLRCSNCSAPLRSADAVAGVVTCEYCGSELRLSGASGALLDAADFRTLPIHGWVTALQPHQIKVEPGPPPELFARLEPTEGAWVVLRSQATYDDFDVSVTLRLLWGDRTSTRGSLLFRRGPHGHYVVSIATAGLFAVTYVSTADVPNTTLLPWAAHPALRTEAGAPNHVRVLFVADRLRVYLNGALVGSVRDSTASFGGVALTAYSKVPMEIAYSGLQIREPEQAEPARAAGGDVFDLVLLELASSAKIQAIKIVRDAAPGLGLKQAKDLVETPNALLLRGAWRTEAERVAADLRSLGCRVELRPPRR